MRVALLHYWLTNVRGGEKVLSALGEMFPDADIFTHAYCHDRMEGLFDGYCVKETFIARLPFGRCHPQIYLPLMPKAAHGINLEGYDLIISSESGPIKGIEKPDGARHICYCHTPMRYLWDMYDDYYRSAGFGGRIAMRLSRDYLRKEDLRSAESVDLFVANSVFVADRIKRIYGRESIVVHPPVDVDFFSECAKETFDRGDYYLFAGAPVKYKRLDLAQGACRRIGRNLVVAGGGNVSREELRRLYGGARALIFPGVEDFGIVPVEAQAAGTPVIAFGKGGALETVVGGETGIFFKKETVESLCGAIEEFESGKWSPEACRRNAARFSKHVFVASMNRVIGRMLGK